MRKADARGRARRERPARVPGRASPAPHPPDDPAEPERDRCQEAAMPTPPSPTITMSSPSRRFARVDDGSAAGQHGAAEHGGDLRRHVGAHGDDRAPVEHRMRCEGRDAEVVVHLAVCLVRPPAAAQQRAGRVRRGAAIAWQPAVGRARRAPAAARQERRHDAVAHRAVGHALPDRLDDAGRLVLEQHGHGPRPPAVDDREIAVAQAGGLDADEQLTGVRRIELELDELDRPGPGVGALGADRPQHRARMSVSGRPSPGPCRPGSPRGSRVCSPCRRTRRRGAAAAGRG